MALTQVTTNAIADDAVTTDKLANAINTARDANTAKVTNATHSGEVTGSGALTITDDTVDEANLKISNSGSNGQFLQKQSGNTGGLTWASVSTTDSTKMPLAGGTFTGDVIFDNATNAGKDLTWDMSDDSLEFADNTKAVFGDGGDLKIYHNGTDNYIMPSNGKLIINNGSETLASFTSDGAVELYYDGTKKLSTTSGGANLEGYLVFDKGDTVKYHRIISNDTGSDLAFQQSAGNSDASYTTYLRIKDGGDVSLPVDSKKLLLGAGDDLEIYHDGSNSYIKNSTNALTIQGAGVYINDVANGKTSAAFDTDGAATLYYDNSAKLQTTSAGGTLTGTWTGAGKVLQVRKANLGSDLNTGSTSWIDTGLSETITLASTSNYIYIILSTTPYIGGGSEERFRLIITVTPSGGSTTTVLEDNYWCYRTSDDVKAWSGHHDVYYQPSSTAELTINVQTQRQAGGDTLWLGRHATDMNTNTLTIMEIAG